MKLIAGYVVAVALLTACVELPNPPPVQSPTIPAGYVCTLAPTAAFSPGFVYRTTQSGEAFLVAEVPLPRSPRAFEVALGGYTATFNSSGGLTANLLAPVGPVSGSVNLGSTSSATSNVSFTDGSFLLLTDKDEEQVVQAARVNIGTPKPGNRYFVVRDVVQARGVKMSLSNQDTSQLGGEGSISQLVSLTPNLTVTQEQNLDVSGTFQNPLNVCMRAVELTFDELGGADAPVEPASPSARIYASPTDVARLLSADSGS